MLYASNEEPSESSQVPSNAKDPSDVGFVSWMIVERKRAPSGEGDIWKRQGQERSQVPSVDGFVDFNSGVNYSAKRDPLASNSVAEANSSEMVDVVQPSCEQEGTMSKTSNPLALPPPNPPSKGNLELAIMDLDMTLIDDVDTSKMAANGVVDTSGSIMQD
ncbi:putative NUDIX hydrolase, FGF-2 [Corchorus olitorius]|uniref:NUDIX hydrolase, FGF-2 n=1 Tax=Corchorus olitorius TaxID=93759 RepID=A0A1R3I477_9ROSI|nr:putative NUDIX hydrolase, FGF-2 [Corchorus olitorius]